MLFLQILDVYDTEVRLRYMAKKGQYYQWPTIEDESVEPYGVITKQLPPPKLVEEISSKRLKYFHVDTESIQTAESGPLNKTAVSVKSCEPAPTETGVTANSVPSEKRQPPQPAGKVQDANSERLYRYAFMFFPMMFL